MIWYLVHGTLSKVHRAARKRRALSQAVASWAKGMPRFSAPAVQSLEKRQLLSNYPNIIVGDGTSSQNNTIELYTYNPNTVNPNNPQPIGFPLPVLPQPATDGPVRGIAYDSTGNIQLYNGTNTPILTTYNTTSLFTDHNGPTGWSASSTLPASGGLAFAPNIYTGPNGQMYGPFLFASDTTNPGLIRFDLGNTYTTVEEETNAENGTETVSLINGQQQQVLLGVATVNVSVGLNGAVYAVATPNAFDNLVRGSPFATNEIQNWAVYEFDQADPNNPSIFQNLDQPSTNATEVADTSVTTPGDTRGQEPFHINLIDPRTGEPIQNVTAVTADANGNLYVATNGSGLFELNPTGTGPAGAGYTLAKSLPGKGSNPGFNCTDLQFDSNGDLLATSGRDVTIFDSNLVAQVSFNLPVATPVSFATWAQSATPTPTPTPTPTSPGGTPTPTPVPTPTPPPLPPPVGTDLTPPVPVLLASNTVIGQLPVYVFRVAYTDSYAVNPNSISSSNVTVTAPDGTSVPVQLTGILNHNFQQYVATYQIPAPTEVGDYTITLQPNQIENLGGAFTAGQGLGAFSVGQSPAPLATGPAPDLVPQITSKLPGAVVAGAKASVKLVVANDGTAPVNSPVQISLFVSPDPELDANATLLGQPYVVNLKIPIKKSKVVKLRFNYPQFLAAGSYYLLADVNSNTSLLETDYSNNAAVSATPTVISPAYVDLGASFPPHRAVTFSLGQSGIAAVTVSNFGNVAATGPLTIDVSATADATSTGTLIAFSHNINLAPGASETIKIKVPLSGLAAGTFNFVADVDPLNTFDESTLSNNIATDPQPFTIL